MDSFSFQIHSDEYAYEWECEVAFYEEEEI